MTIEGGIVGQLESDAAQIVDNSTIELGQSTQAAVRQHEERSAGAVQDATIQYFQGKHGQAITPEELALLHYLQSGGEGLPDTDQLAPRREAATRAFEVVTAADMLFVPGQRDYVIAKPPKGKEPKITLNSYDMRVDEGFFRNARVELSGLRRLRLDIFNLIGRDDLATPVDTTKGVDALFRTRREEITVEGPSKPDSYLPLIAGSMAVRRFVVNLATRVPVREQHVDVEDPSDRSFYGLTRELAEADLETGSLVVEEVRHRKPGVLAAIKKGLKGQFDEILEAAFDDVDYPELTEVLDWFDDSPARLFHTAEELDQIKEGMISTYKTQLETQASKKIAEVTGSLKA
jgi:hypothetical protein